MNRHVKIIRFEGIGHVSKRSEIVVPAGLLEAKSDRRFATFLGEDEDEDEEKYAVDPYCPFQ